MLSSFIDVTFDPFTIYQLNNFIILPASSNIRTIMCLFCSQITSMVSDVWNGLGNVVTFMSRVFWLLVLVAIESRSASA